MNETEHEYYNQVMTARNQDIETTLDQLRIYLKQRQHLSQSDIFDEELLGCKGMFLMLNDYIKQIIGL